MARNEHFKIESDQMLWGSQERKRRVSKKSPPAYEDKLADYTELLQKLLRSYTDLVNHLFPNADFLSNQKGSHISTSTPLSFVIRTRYPDLTQMQLPKGLIENHQKTVHRFLEGIRHNTASRETYTQLNSIIRGYESLSDAMGRLKEISAELKRLVTLSLTANTIDRQLKGEWAERCILTPLNALLPRIQKIIDNNPGAVSHELTGCVNSLAGFARHLQSTAKAPARTQAAADHKNEDHIGMAATVPAAA